MAMTPDPNTLLEEITEWLDGRRSHWNTYADFTPEQATRAAMCAVEDAMEIVKRAAAMVALRARYGP